MAVNMKNMDLEAAKASAREAALARKTCEGCTALRTYPRPMSAGEKSPHFRTARDTYHERCPWYAVGGSAPQPIEPVPVAGPSDGAQLRLLQARNRTRRVGA